MFYGKFNGNISALGKCSNEITALQLLGQTNFTVFEAESDYVFIYSSSVVKT